MPTDSQTLPSNLDGVVRAGQHLEDRRRVLVDQIGGLQAQLSRALADEAGLFRDIVGLARAFDRLAPEGTAWPDWAADAIDRADMRSGRGRPVTTGAWVRVREVVERMGVGTDFTVAGLVAGLPGVPRPTVSSCLSDLQARGVVERVGRGCYQRKGPTS